MSYRDEQTYLPSSRGRILLCWISVMCSKPIPFTAFSVCSLTSSAREAKDVSSNAPETSVQLVSECKVDPKAGSF